MLLVAAEVSFIIMILSALSAIIYLMGLVIVPWLHKVGLMYQGKTIFQSWEDKK